MANKRVSELASINYLSLDNYDLLFLTDLSAHESKKLTLQDLSYFLRNSGFFSSGSFHGTSSWATYASTASYGGSQQTASYSITSSLALSSMTASYCTSSVTASYSISGSCTLTASYALTASSHTSLNSTFAIYAQSASYLTYNPLLANGTASLARTASYSFTASYISSSVTFDAGKVYVLTASYVLTSSLAKTASYAMTASYNKSSSHALLADYVVNGGSGGGGSGVVDGGSYNISTSYASASISASYLNYDGTFNGTASYAMATGPQLGNRISYGLFYAITQSAQVAQIDQIISTPTNGGYTSDIEVFGTYYLPYSVSTPTNGKIDLISLDRWSGITQSLDSTPVYAMTDNNGEMRLPFSLFGEADLSGSNMVYVSASGDIRLELDSTRRVRFNISSYSDSIIAASGPTMSFTVYPKNTLVDFEYIENGDPHFIFDSTADFIVANHNDTVSKIFIQITADTQITNLWTLTTLYFFQWANNHVLTDIGGVPNTLLTMSVENCSITKLAPLKYTLVDILWCNGNQLLELPELPPTMSYINCSNNLQLSTLPHYLPYGLKVFIASYTNISELPLILPATLVTMSVYNTPLATWNPSIPSSIKYLDCHNTELSSLPTISPSTLYLDVSYCNMTDAAMNNICNLLISYGLTHGTLSTVGNNVYSSDTLTKMAILTNRSWMVVF